MTSLVLQASPLLRLEVMDGVWWCCCLSVWLSVCLSSLVAAPATRYGHLICWSRFTGLLLFLLVFAVDSRWMEASSSQWKTWAAACQGLNRKGKKAQCKWWPSRPFIGCFRVGREGGTWSGRGWVLGQNPKPAKCLWTAMKILYGLLDKNEERPTAHV